MHSLRLYVSTQLSETDCCRLHADLLRSAAACSGLQELRVSTGLLPLPDVEVCSLVASLPSLRLLRLFMLGAKLWADAPMTALSQLHRLELHGSPVRVLANAILPTSRTQLRLGAFAQDRLALPPQVCSGLGRVQPLGLCFASCTVCARAACAHVAHNTACACLRARCCQLPLGTDNAGRGLCSCHAAAWRTVTVGTPAAGAAVLQLPGIQPIEPPDCPIRTGAELHTVSWPHMPAICCLRCRYVALLICGAHCRLVTPVHAQTCNMIPCALRLCAPAIPTPVVAACRRRRFCTRSST